MKDVKVTELRQNLPAYLARVRRGPVAASAVSLFEIATAVRCGAAGWTWGCR